VGRYHWLGSLVAFLPPSQLTAVTMADLDDFFAKKDKKKKGTKKFSKANTDVIAKNLEETAIKEQMQQDKEITNIGDDLNVENVNQQDDDEWDDYRENKKDYTGLKIENLTVEDPTVKPEEEKTEVNEHGELVKKEESGPWNKKDAERTNSSEAPESPVVEVKPLPGSDPPNVVGGTYVPPNRRGAADSSAPSVQPMRAEDKRPRRMKAAPDISSSINFPSLSSAAEDTAPKGAWGKKLVKDEGAFEEVRRDGSALQSQQRGADGPKLTLGNRFDGLRDE